MMRLLLVCLLLVTYIDAAPNRRQNPADLQGLTFSVGNMRNEVNNHESEIVLLKERLNYQETALDLLREDLHAKKSDPAIYEIERKVLSLVGDIQKLREHSNEVSEAVSKTHNRMNAVERSLDQQNKNIQNMELALKSVLDAFDIKDPTGNEKYQVKSGDSLEKIARRHKVSVDKLKTENNLKGDKIRIGQTLRIPNSLS